MLVKSRKVVKLFSIVEIDYDTDAKNMLHS